MTTTLVCTFKFRKYFLRTGTRLGKCRDSESKEETFYLESLPPSPGHSRTCILECTTDRTGPLAPLHSRGEGRVGSETDGVTFQGKDDIWSYRRFLAPPGRP